MSWSKHIVAFTQQHLVMVIEQTSARLVYVWPKKAFRTADGYSVRATSPLATSASRSKEVIIAPSPPDIGCLHKRSRYLAWLRSLLYV